MNSYFGTDGIRGKAGAFPLDDRTMHRTGRAISIALASSLGRPPRVLVGRDTRESGPHIEALLASGIVQENGSVASAGVLTTPGVACVTRLEQLDAGVVISASHNPYHDNGIKVFSPSGQKLNASMESEIERLIDELPDTDVSGHPLETETSHSSTYVEWLKSEVADSLDLSGLRIVVDCANGAAYEIAPALLASLGADVVSTGVEPDGRNINEGCGSLHLERMASLVLESSADLGVAFDGDADRSLFVDETGNAIDGDQTLFALGLDLKSRGLLSGDRVVATVMSNIGLEIALREQGVELARTPVGDKNVLDELIRSQSSLGGEQSGHIIFPRISLAGDGLITTLELLKALRRSAGSASALVSGMRRYPQILLNVRVSQKRRFEDVPEIASEARRVEDELQGSGRLLLRYSGTENLARVMIEGSDQEIIEEQARRIADVIRAAIGEA